MDGTATNLFEMNREHYLVVVVDYFSRYPEVIKLQSLQLSSFIFFWHGIPEVVRSDNGSVCIPRVCHFQRVIMFLIHKLTSVHGDTTRSWLTIPTSSKSRAHSAVLCWLIKKHDHLGTVHNKFEVCSQNSGFTHFHQVNWSNTNTRDVARKHSQLSLMHELPFQFLIHSCWSKPNGCWSSLLSLPPTLHLHSVDPVPMAIGQGTWVVVRFHRHFLTTTHQPFPERFRNRWRN